MFLQHDGQSILSKATYGVVLETFPIVIEQFEDDSLRRLADGWPIMVPFAFAILLRRKQELRILWSHTWASNINSQCGQSQNDLDLYGALLQEWKPFCEKTN